MSELTKEWLLTTIAELEEERDATPGAVNEDAAMALAAMKLALASLEANGTLANEGTITATQFKPVADLYEVTVPSGRSTTFTKDAAEASDCRVMGWSVQEYVKLERYQAAMLQGADGNAPAHFRSRPAQSSLSPAQGGNSPVIPDGWVACSERMPEAGDDMIVFTDDIVMSGISYSKKKGFYIQALEYDDDEPVDNVTHWMPLPAAPQHK
ncbi:DUF551 domain-containing protein [Enterobacter hormaechei]|nr:DUF551 domain-containing protein [Enterobacter hormaechei]